MKLTHKWRGKNHFGNAEIYKASRINIKTQEKTGLIGNLGKDLNKINHEEQTENVSHSH